MKASPMLVALVILCTATIFAQTSTVDILYLKNGSIIRGQVIELAAGNVKIKTADGSLFVYAMTDVDKMIKETPAPAPVPEPAAAPVQPAPRNPETKNVSVDPPLQETAAPAPEKKKGVSFAIRGGLFANLEMWNNLGKSSLMGLNGEPDSKIGFGLMGLLTAGVDIGEDLYVGVGPHLGGNFWSHSETIAKYKTSVQITPLDLGVDFAFGFDDMYFVFGTGSSTVRITAEVGSESQTLEIPDKAPYKRIQFGWADGLGLGFSIVSYAEPFQNLSRLEFNLGFAL